MVTLSQKDENMINVERIIKGLKACSHSGWCEGKDDCPYWNDEANEREQFKLCNQLQADAIKLLKQQESLIHFLKHQREKGHWIFGNTNGHGWMKCSQCCVSQISQTLCFSFCPNCGASMEEDDSEQT